MLHSQAVQLDVTLSGIKLEENGADFFTKPCRHIHQAFFVKIKGLFQSLPIPVLIKFYC